MKPTIHTGRCICGRDFTATILGVVVDDAWLRDLASRVWTAATTYERGRRDAGAAPAPQVVLSEGAVKIDLHMPQPGGMDFERNERGTITGTRPKAA